MALDAIPTYPSEYDGTGTTNNPPGSDSRRQGDDQLRILKANLQQAFSNIAGAVTATHQELNTLAGVSLTDPIITLPVGTIMLFEAPAAAPTGWVKKTDAAYNDVAIRINTGTLTQGGTYEFSTLFRELSVSATTLTVDQFPAHDHGGGSHQHNLQQSSLDGNSAFGPSSYFAQQDSAGNNYMRNSNAASSKAGLVVSSGTIINTEGGGSSHNHPFDNRLKYRDVYFAEKT